MIFTSQVGFHEIVGESAKKCVLITNYYYTYSLIRRAYDKNIIFHSGSATLLKNKRYRLVLVNFFDNVGFNVQRRRAEASIGI